MNWPDKARYCVHIFALDQTQQPHEVEQRFTTTLRVPGASYPEFRLRKGLVAHWWEFSAGCWWAKAHDRTFEREDRWADRSVPA